MAKSQQTRLSTQENVHSQYCIYPSYVWNCRFSFNFIKFFKIHFIVLKVMNLSFRIFWYFLFNINKSIRAWKYSEKNLIMYNKLHYKTKLFCNTVAPDGLVLWDNNIDFVSNMTYIFLWNACISVIQRNKFFVLTLSISSKL